jgi:hypothetical protein
VGFGKAVQVLDFCCSYRRIADEECSATTPRDLRDECIESETMEALREKHSRPTTGSRADGFLTAHFTVVDPWDGYRRA